jgi:hypothetical protein
MTSAPREWPNVAKEARDRSAEAAVMGIRALEPLIEGPKMNEVEVIRRIALALNHYQQIARLLENVGACTRP